MIPWWEMIVRLVVAGVLGGVIGYQRERIERPAGFRTHILVSLGSALMMLISVYPFLGGQTADPTRIAAGVITGMGFLGAGTIIRQGSIVRGLTTAASLWTASGIGLAVGVGFYVPAAVTTVLVFLVLAGLKRVEIGMGVQAAPGQREIAVATIDRPGQLGKIFAVLGKLKADIRNIAVEQDGEDQVLVRLALSVPRGRTDIEIVEGLQRIDGVREVRLD